MYFATLGDVARVYPGSFRVLHSSEVISLILCKMIQTGFACVAMSPLLQFTFRGTITVIGLTKQLLTSISLVVSVVAFSW